MEGYLRYRSSREDKEFSLGVTLSGAKQEEKTPVKS